MISIFKINIASYVCSNKIVIMLQAAKYSLYYYSKFSEVQAQTPLKKSLYNIAIFMSHGYIANTEHA